MGILNPGTQTARDDAEKQWVPARDLHGESEEEKEKSCFLREQELHDKTTKRFIASCSIGGGGEPLLPMRSELLNLSETPPTDFPVFPGTHDEATERDRRHHLRNGVDPDPVTAAPITELSPPNAWPLDNTADDPHLLGGIEEVPPYHAARASGDTRREVILVIPIGGDDRLQPPSAIICDEVRTRGGDGGDALGQWREHGKDKGTRRRPEGILATDHGGGIESNNHRRFHAPRESREP